LEGFFIFSLFLFPHFSLSLYNIICLAKPKHIALLVNSRSGKNKAFTNAQLAESVLKQQQIQSSTFIDSWPGQLNSYSDIWIFGGDGTLNFFINQYPTCTVPLSIFASGTGNDFAFILYKDLDPVKQACFVLNAPERKVDAGSCNGKLFMNGVGLGFDGEVLKVMKQIRKVGGGLGYLLAVIREVFFYSETSFEIVSDQHSEHKKLLLFMVNNSSRTGGGFHVSPLSTIDDGLLDLVTCNPLSVFKRLLHLPKIKAGKHLRLPFVKHQPLQNISVRTNKKVYGQLDGELIEGDRFEFVVLKDKFLFRY
jgi:diacylglycerol kinase (ATP)